MPPRFSEATAAEMRRMLQNGSTYEAIAYECGVHAKTVARWAKRWGFLPVADWRWSSRTLQGVALVQQGMSINAAERRLGMSRSHLSKACRARGVQSSYLTGGKRRAAA